MRTLLPVPDMAEAVGGVLGRTVRPEEIHALIRARRIEPFGRLVKAPAFTLDQVSAVAEVLKQGVTS